MTFIITLVVLLTERFYNWSHLRCWRWFFRYQAVFDKRLAGWPPTISLLICILPIVLVVGLANYSLSWWLYSVIKILFNVGVLLYCLGPDNFWAEGFKITHALKNDDPQLARQAARALTGRVFSENNQTFHREVACYLLVMAYQQVFAIIFWFIILGPAGCVFYRLVSLSCTEQSRVNIAASKLLWLLDWLPTRIFTLLFALGGHYTETLARWRQDVFKVKTDSQQVVAECGMAALAINETTSVPWAGELEQQVLALTDRTCLMLLVILGIVAYL